VRPPAQFGPTDPPYHSNFESSLILISLPLLAPNIAGIPGDIIETGVWRGGAMMFAQSILVAYGEVGKRNIYLCDSWTGIPPVNATEFPKDKVHEGSDKFPLAVADGPEGVKEAFKRLGIWGTNIRLVQGWFKDTLHKLTEIEKIAVLRLDGDLYQSTWEALHALYPKLQVDGYLIIDDYLDWAGCKEAITDFRKKYGITDTIEEVKHDPGQTKRGAYWIKTATGGGSGFKPLYTV
jgi:O-methyltransferase